MSRITGVTAVVLVCCVAVFLHAESVSSKNNQDKRDLARMIVAQEIHKRHWRWWGQDRAEFIEQMFRDALPEPFGISWEARFLTDTPELNAINIQAKPDSFEENSINSIKTGTPEAWEEVDGKWRYVTALRAKKSCRACHAATDESQADIVAYASLTLR